MKRELNAMIGLLQEKREELEKMLLDVEYMFSDIEDLQDDASVHTENVLKELDKTNRSLNRCINIVGNEIEALENTLYYYCEN